MCTICCCSVHGLRRLFGQRCGSGIGRGQLSGPRPLSDIETKSLSEHEISQRLAEHVRGTLIDFYASLAACATQDDNVTRLASVVHQALIGSEVKADLFRVHDPYEMSPKTTTFNGNAPLAALHGFDFLHNPKATLQDLEREKSEQPLEHLRRAIAALHQHRMIQWGQASWYVGAPPHTKRIRETEADACLVGPPSLDAAMISTSDDVLVGVFLQGSSTFYPPHHHPAEELYTILEGSASWFLGKWPVRGKPPFFAWEQRGAGQCVAISPPNVHHAMTTADKGFFAVWAWVKFTDINPLWCDCDSVGDVFASVHE